MIRAPRCRSWVYRDELPALTRNGLEFRKVPVLRTSPGGTPYVKLVEVGMPFIPPQLRNSVFYLYSSIDDANNGNDSGGAGFLLGMCSELSPRIFHLYACTNYHHAVRDGFTVIRFNTKDGNTDSFEFDSADWEFAPGGGDFAVAAIKVDLDKHEISYIGIDSYHGNTSFAMTEEEENAEFLGCGDEVVMIGRFVDHDGGSRNEPAMRFGNISIRPTKVEDMANSGPDVRYYCLDMHSRTGFSGSPVICYRTVGGDLGDLFNGRIDMSNIKAKLLAIHCGQFPDEFTVDGATVTGRSGMTSALPIWRVVNFINTHPRFIELRETAKRYYKQKGIPCQE